MTQTQSNYELRENKVYLENKLIATISDEVITYASGQIKRFHAEGVKAFLDKQEDPPETQSEDSTCNQEEQLDQTEEEQPPASQQSINGDTMGEDPLEPPLPDQDRFFGCYTYEWFASDLYRLGKDGFLAKWNPFKKNNKQQYDAFLKQLEESRYSQLAETINQ